jgi:hypothetical protein
MKQTPEEIIGAKMKVAAQRAGMIDLDALKLADTSKVTLEADGTVKGADELMTALKEAKPYLFGKHVRDMSLEEQAAALKELKRGPKPEPMPIDKTAKEMTPAQRAEFIREVNRRFG